MNRTSNEKKWEGIAKDCLGEIAGYERKIRELGQELKDVSRQKISLLLKINRAKALLEKVIDHA